MNYSRENYEKYQKPWRAKNRQKVNDINRKGRERLRRAVIEILGGKCVICNRDNATTQLVFHEKYGKPHNRSFKYILEHSEDYILLCRPHHASIHRLKNEGKIDIMIDVLTDLL